MVYFIQALGGGPVKIGFTDRGMRGVRLRLEELQVANPHELRAVAIIAGDMATEAELHERLRRWHIRGEWFEPKGLVAELMHKHRYAAQHLEKVVKRDQAELEHGERMAKLIAKAERDAADLFGRCRVHSCQALVERKNWEQHLREQHGFGKLARKAPRFFERDK